LDVSKTVPRKIANVGVMDGVDDSMGKGVLVGKSVGVEVDVREGETSMVDEATTGAVGSDDPAGAQETNIHVKQIPIMKCLNMMSFIVRSARRQ
jgi:hypothetical protein